jgi:hypothetical protein
MFYGLANKYKCSRQFLIAKLCPKEKDFFLKTFLSGLVFNSPEGGRRDEKHSQGA